MDERLAGRRVQGAEEPRPPGTTPGVKLPFPPPRLEPACLCQGPSRAEAGRRKEGILDRQRTQSTGHRLDRLTNTTS